MGASKSPERAVKRNDPAFPTINLVLCSRGRNLIVPDFQLFGRDCSEKRPMTKQRNNRKRVPGSRLNCSFYFNTLSITMKVSSNKRYPT